MTKSMVRLNHIGVAVANLPELQKLLSILGLSEGSSEHVPDQGVQTYFFPLPQTVTNIELLVPTDAEGTVAKFLDKRGPGIHHLSFECDRGSLDPLSAKLRAAGFRLIYDAPKAGAHGMRVNFIHPASAGGMLIEIMEKA